MKILITGAFGYIGARLSTYLYEEGEIDIKLGTRWDRNLPSNMPFARVVKLDWGNQKSINDICSGVNCIIHLSAIDAATAEKDPALALEINGVNTVRLLEAAIDNKVSKFIYVSTAHVYGAPLVGELKETTMTFPIHPYATSHKAGEDVVMAANALDKICGIVLRLSNCYGVPVYLENNCWQLAIPDMCKQAVTKREIKLKTYGEQRRNFLPMEDAVRAIRHFVILPKDELSSNLYNVGGSWTTNLWKVAKVIQNRAEIYLDSPVVLSRGPKKVTSAINSFHYNIKLLLSAGFELKANKEVEIDNLIEYCDAKFA